MFKKIFSFLNKKIEGAYRRSILKKIAMRELNDILSLKLIDRNIYQLQKFSILNQKDTKKLQRTLEWIRYKKRSFVLYIWSESPLLRGDFFMFVFILSAILKTSLNFFDLFFYILYIFNIR